MAFLEWNEKYSVNVGRFDGAHQRLIDIINRLHDAMSAGKGSSILNPLLAELREYTETHFREEEELMGRHQYPELEQHRELHRVFERKLVEFEMKLAEGRVMISLEVMSFLRDWLVEHILRIDKKYSNFFAEKGIQ